MKTQRAPQLATSRTGTIDGSGSVTKDKYPALVANKEAILNAGAAEAFAKLIGMSINEFNAIYAPKGAETKVVNGVVHAAAGASGIKDWYYGGHDNAGNKIVDAASRNIIEPLAKTNLTPLSLMGQDVTNKVREGVGDTIGAVIDNSSPALISKALSPSPAPSILPPTNQVSAPKSVATNDEVANTIRGLPNPVANIPEFTPTGGVRSNVATGEQQPATSAAPSLLPTAKINNPSKLDYETMPAGFTKQVQKNGNISYSDRPMTTADAPVMLSGANNPTPQSRFAGVDPVQPEAQYQTQQEPSIITPEMQLRMQQGLPVTGESQPSNQSATIQPRSANGSSGQGSGFGMGDEGQSAPTLAGKSEAPASQSQPAPASTQSQQTETPPPSINNGRLVQQPAPPLLTPLAPQPKQRGFVAPQIQGILSPENQAALNEQVSRNLLTMNRGTGNMSDALATKYAQKSMDTILGKDTQDRSAGQANNNQAQDESQYQRTAKQRQSEEAWNQLLQSDASNYGKMKDQQSLATGKRQLEFDAVKEAQKQANFEREQAQKENAPVDYKSINESGEQRSRTMTPKQLKSYESDYNDALRALEIHKDNPEMIAKIKEKMALRGFN